MPYNFPSPSAPHLVNATTPGFKQTLGAIVFPPWSQWNQQPILCFFPPKYMLNTSMSIYLQSPNHTAWPLLEHD